MEERKSALAYMHPKRKKEEKERRKSHVSRLECVQLARLDERE